MNTLTCGRSQCVDQMFWLEFNGCQGTSGGIVRARYPCIEVRGQCIWRVTGNQSLNSSYHCRQPNGKHYCNLVPAALIKNVKILVSYQWIGWKRRTKMVGELLIKGELHRRLDKKLVSLRKSWASKFSDAVWHGKYRLRSLLRKLTFSR